jgi:NAD(P) transhydrogenase subunit alpha
MIIGILKEPAGENRVVMLPEAVKTLISWGAEVLVEQNAGKNAYASDSGYEEAGAQCLPRKQVFEKAQFICSIHPISGEELATISKNGIYLGQLSPLFTPDYTSELIDSGLTVFSMDLVPRTTRAQAMDVLSSMATATGYKAVLMAADLLPRFFPMFMTAAGSISPSRVLVLGAGVAGLQAIATAKRLGAIVYAFDVRQAAKEEVLSLGAKFVEIEGALEDKTAGGYAVEQSAEFLQKQKDAIHEHASKADVIITTAQIPGKKAPVLVEERTVHAMKPGSVIIDLAASTGGNCALSQPDTTIEVNGVRIVGVNNLAASLPQDASKMYGKNLLNFLKLLIKDGQIQLNFDDDIVHGTCVCHAGEAVNTRVKSLFQTKV